MSHGPEHHIEHAEHATHATHNPFDRRVTISIAMVAAVLACVTMLGHRAHNETLRLQGEALRAETEGGIKHALASNQWAFYQAQNIRSHMYQAFEELADFSPSSDAKNREKATKRWQAQVAKYEKNLEKIQEEAKALTEEGKKSQEKAEKLLDEAELMHHRGDRFDLGELGLQLGVVLCSLAILTRSRPFWYLGLAASIVGAAVAMTGFFDVFMGGHH